MFPSFGLGFTDRPFSPVPVCFLIMMLSALRLCEPRPDFLFFGSAAFFTSPFQHPFQTCGISQDKSRSPPFMFSTSFQPPCHSFGVRQIASTPLLILDFSSPDRLFRALFPGLVFFNSFLAGRIIQMFFRQCRPSLPLELVDLLNSPCFHPCR